jgi:hypothetical protein
MKHEFIAIYTSNTATKVTKHSNLFAAQRSLLRFVQSKKCRDIPARDKAGIRNYIDLVRLAFLTAVQGGWSAFVVEKQSRRNEVGAA